MGTVTGQSVGIDVSEDFLDVYLHPVGKELRVPNNDEGTASLLALLREQPVERVVLESTGGLQRRLVRSLQEAGYAVSAAMTALFTARRHGVHREVRGGESVLFMEVDHEADSPIRGRERTGMVECAAKRPPDQIPCMR